MRTITFLQPRKLVFGSGCVADCSRDLQGAGFRSVFLVTTPPTRSLAEQLVGVLRGNGISVTIYDRIEKEPTIGMFEEALRAARSEKRDVVVGLGGGSSLDTAKLVAALHDATQGIRDVFGINLVVSRRTYLVCLPTTSGTGSEVSPNAILLDEQEQLKKGVVSPFLVPDATYVDPLLTVTMPPEVTAGTGMDALTHCIEVYANKYAHPMVDTYALEGVRLIGKYLPRAVSEGDDLEARANMAIASVYGGLGLGPVNTAAVHALSYPLGGKFHVAHGVSNAVLLPHVLEFNLPAAPERYADVAIALGVEPAKDPLETAKRGVERIRQLAKGCRIQMRLSDFNIPENAIPRMAEEAMKVTRLLKNNLREVTAADAEAIYRRAYA